jgi:hypothetical protein
VFHTEFDTKTSSKFVGLKMEEEEEEDDDDE